MKWLYRHLYRKEKGFTLVELMVVIIILAVLTAIAIPSYMALRNRARIAAAQSELKNIATALEVYNSDIEEYPAEADWSGDLEDGEYMVPVPTTDPWNVAYIYNQPGLGAATGYTLYSCGPDKADDSGAAASDDIVITDGQLQE